MKCKESFLWLCDELAGIRGAREGAFSLVSLERFWGVI